MAKTIKCPIWGCDGVGIPADTKKKFSMGKALVGNTVGGLAFGPVGLLLVLLLELKAKEAKPLLCVQNVAGFLKLKYKNT